MGVALALLASFGTIVAFFSFTTDSYPFMVLLNVVLFAVSGFLSLGFLLQTLDRLTEAQLEAARPPLAPPPAESDPTSPTDPTTKDLTQPGALDRYFERPPARSVQVIFRIWILVFGLVGAQMSWVLRPFIGKDPYFVLFRPRGSNFFQAVFAHLSALFGGS
jgi:hypothetical protein